MAIRFKLKNYNSNTLNTLRNNASAHLSGLSVRAAGTLERAKLMRAIYDLEDEVALQMCAIGELVYATHRGNPSDSDELQKILDYVDDLHDEIDAHEQQLKLLSGIVPCPVCDGDVREGDVYCQNCGQPLPVSVPKQS